jgi:hypothetical protein
MRLSPRVLGCGLDDMQRVVHLELACKPASRLRAGGGHATIEVDGQRVKAVRGQMLGMRAHTFVQAEPVV